MDLLNNPLIRRTLVPQPDPDPHAEPRKRASRFEDMDEDEVDQHAEELVDDAAYRPWDEDLKGFVRIMNLKDHWPGLRGVFQKSFSEHVDDLINAHRAQP